MTDSAPAMKDGWRRETPRVELDRDALTRLVQPAFPGRHVERAQPLVAGLRNTNIRLTLSDGEPEVVLRLYTHGADVAAREAAIARLVADRVPVARFLHVAPTNDVTGHAYAILEWVDGVLLQSAVADLGRNDLHTVARSLGAVLAAIRSFRFPRAGFLAADLTVTEPVDLGSRGFLAYARSGLSDGRGRERLGPALADRFLELAAREAAILDGTATQPPSLVHSDFDVSNLVVRRTAAGLAVSAVLDWEFAYAGSILADVGHLLRPPLGALDGFEHRLAEGFTAAGGRLGPGWQQTSRLLDSIAWIEFANRETVDDLVVAAAREVLTALLNIRLS